MGSLSSSTNELDELAQKYGTDKSSLIHGYTKWYDGYFRDIREEPLTVLELGWGGHEDPSAGGASAKMWRDYFINGTVVCVDIEEKEITSDHDGINFRKGDQADDKFIDELVDEFKSFDIVVDDASHLSSLTIKSWELLYPHLNRGGVYVVEDTHMSYHSFYYGKREASPNPDVPTIDGSPTLMQYFKRMTDEVNFMGRKPRSNWDLFPKKYWKGYELEWVHFYFNILFAKKR